MKAKTKFLAIGIVSLSLIVLMGCPQPTADDDPADTDNFEVIDFDLNGDGTVDDGEAESVDYKVSTLIDEDGDPILDEEFRQTRVIEGTFTDDVWLTDDTLWILEGAVRVGTNELLASAPAAADKATMYIEAGTEIRGRVSAQRPGALFIQRNGRVEADGELDFDTPSGSQWTTTAVAGDPEPIIFTSANSVGSRAPGDWGGLVLNGYARVQGGTANGEGNSGSYGGGTTPTDTDDSGKLRYVVVQFAGTLFGADDELNGIAFQGVGSGTEVEYIQVHQNADDGVEFFGGSVQARYIVLTGNNDDSLDADDGWNGSAQFVVIQQYSGNNSILEMDGDATDVFAPSNAIIANVTGIGASTDREAGVVLKSDAEQVIYNSLFVNLGGAVDAIDTSEAGAGAELLGVVLEGTGVELAEASDFDATANDTTDSTNGNRWSSTADDLVTWPDTDHLDGPAFNGQPTSVDAGTAQSIPATDPHGNALIDTSFIGAIDPAATDDWTEGWTFFPEN